MPSQPYSSWSGSGENLPGSGKPCRLITRNTFTSKWILLLMAAMLVLPVQRSAGAAGAASRGEFGGDLNLLASFLSGPQSSQESNYHLDMWAGRQMAQVARLNGLTNNQTLFINSHGRGGVGVLGHRYGFYPHESLVAYQSRFTAPTFSVRDIAQVLGQDAVAKILHVVVSSCDLEGCFSATEVKKHFPNAMTVIHTPQWQAGYQPMFFSAMVNPSRNIHPLYEVKVPGQAGKPRFEVRTEPKPGAKKMYPYVAQLFLPGAKKPYRTQMAGRELLENHWPALLLAQAGKKVGPEGELKD